MNKKEKSPKPSTFADRIDDQNKCIVSEKDPEMVKYFAEMAKRLGLPPSKKPAEDEDDLDYK